MIKRNPEDSYSYFLLTGYTFYLEDYNGINSDDDIIDDEADSDDGKDSDDAIVDGSSYNLKMNFLYIYLILLFL